MAKHRNRRYGKFNLLLDSLLTITRRHYRSILIPMVAVLPLYCTAVTAEVSTAELFTEQLKKAHHLGRTGVYPEIADQIDRALAASREQNNPLETSALLRSRWLLAHYQDQLQVGHDAIIEALAIAETAGASADTIASLQRDLAYTYNLKGQFGEAIRILRRCVVYRMSSQEFAELERDLYTLGDAYLKNGEFAIARRYFNQVREVGTGEPIIAAAARLKLGTISRLEGDLQTAIAEHKATRDYFRANAVYRDIVAEIELARDFLEVDDLERAEYSALTAITDDRALIEQELDAALVLLEVGIRRGDDTAVATEFARAEALISKSVRDASTEFANPLRQLELATMAVRYFGDAEMDQAVSRYARHAKRLIRRIGENLGGDMSARLAWSSKIKPFVEAYIASLYPGDPELLASELEELYSIVPNGSVAGQSSSVDELAAINDYLAAESAVVDARAGADSNDSAAAHNALEQAMRSRDIARDRYLANRTRPSGRADHGINAKREFFVPDGQLYLRYFIQDSIAIVIAKDSQQVTVHDLPKRSDLAATVTELRNALLPGSDSSRTERRRQLKKARALIPWDRIGPNTFTLVIVTDDLLHGVPFSAISRSKEGYQPLYETAHIVRASSGSEYFSEPVPRQPTAAGVFVFADPDFQAMPAKTPAPQLLASSALALQRSHNWVAQLKPLPFTRKEAESIASLYPNQVTLATGPKATRTSLLSEAARSAAILHVATHGYFDEDTPDIVGIATTAESSHRPGFLGLTEMLSYPFHNSLIVISACDTMLGRRYDGLGVHGLSQGLLANGAAAVIGSLWPVPDRSTAEFMNAFYAAMKENAGDVPAALDAARDAMIASKRYASPTYWAAFAYTASNSAVERISLQPPSVDIAQTDQLQTPSGHSRPLQAHQ